MRGIGFVGLIACFLAVPGTASYGQKKEFPEREIKITCATAGSVSDLWSRAIADDYSKILNVPVVVDNRGGGLSQLVVVKKAKPDGYTLAYISQSNVVTFLTGSNPPVDLMKDFVPIGSLGNFPTLIVVESSSPFLTFEDLINYAKKNPGKLNCGSAGLLISYFNFELLKRHAKVDIQVVQFKGSSPATAALLGKHVDLLTLSPTAIVGLMKAGRIRALLTTQKLKDFPNIPLFSEKGLSEAGMNAWSGLFAPTGIPKDARNKLIDAFEKLAKDPNVVKRLEMLDYSADYLKPSELGVVLKQDHEKIGAIVKELGLKE
jgi:tripartite-type tricarboxylate transporter receptor subunit TctC